MPDETYNTAAQHDVLTSAAVREEMVESLWLDLIGPTNDHPFANELLPETPTRWYLTGFLVPTNAPDDQKFDETSADDIDAPADGPGTDDESVPDKAAAKRSLLPSSMGLSVLVSAKTNTLDATVEWGDYHYEGPDGQPEPAGVGGADDKSDTGDDGNEGTGSQTKSWRRQPNTQSVPIKLPKPGDKPTYTNVPESHGLRLVTTARGTEHTALPKGTRAVSVFLVNYREPTEPAYKAFVFQARLRIHSKQGYVPRPDPRGGDLEDEWDNRIADLQYRDVFEFAVGHGVSTESEVDKGRCHTVQTQWIPTAEVERVAPALIPDTDLGMEALGQLKDVNEARTKLGPLISHYRKWITQQRGSIGTLTDPQQQTAKDMLSDAEIAADRIQAGIDLLEQPQVLDAFNTANRVMALAARQRFAIQQKKPPNEVEAPTWYPFQIAFILMALRGIVDPKQGDRKLVDLLFFPTGGGKTEAYLGLAAFTLVLRRLRNPGITSAGLAVLMRYTLRLLTLDQLGRGAALICALEMEREKRPNELGTWPFEIGLWVGQAATPNRMGKRGDKGPGREYTAYTKTQQFKRDDRKPSPIPIEECPWCGEKFTRDSFMLVPNLQAPTDLRIHCANYKCAFTGDRHLPIVAVDEPLYRRLPCFMIATVDKFAALPWVGETGTLFGKVDRYDQDGFYGPCDPGRGTPLPDRRLHPPDLIIQDELHLISGPLGTIAGLYETAIESLCTVHLDSGSVKPKIIASTATVRRAQNQIRAVFNRPHVRVFPPPGPDRRDSYFAETLPSSKSPARLYIGVAAQGRSLKVVMLRAGLALLSAGQTMWELAGGKKTNPNPADPYMTWLGYFNSLRELGGSRRIIEDEVRTRLGEYGRRRRLEPEDKLFINRSIDFDALELTSRVTTDKVAEAKRRLALAFTDEKERVDVALATNMISVGLDIVRLGMMLVLGQPKTSSEYIQATSRVGRDPNRPGLVATLLNIHKPRDRSHYERFGVFHESFYRSVEATSVTPFSPRALDRALAATLVADCRHGYADMTPPTAAQKIIPNRTTLDAVANHIAERAREHRDEMTEDERDAIYRTVLNRCTSLLDDWATIARQTQQGGAVLQYQNEAPKSSRRLLYHFLDPQLDKQHPIYRRFRANRSMRDVEPSVEIEVKNLNDWGVGQ